MHSTNKIEGDFIYLVDFSAIFYKGDNFDDFLFAKPVLQRGLF